MEPQSSDFDLIVSTLQEKKVFNQRMVDDIKRSPGQLGSSLKDRLLLHLCRLGPNAFFAFLDILKTSAAGLDANDMNDNPIVSQLNLLHVEGIRWLADDGYSMAGGAEDAAENMDVETVDGPFLSKSKHQANGDSDESTLQTLLKLDASNLVIDEWYNRFTQTVRTGSDEYTGPEIYRMQSMTRGYCLIINNVVFKARRGTFSDALPTRHGSRSEEAYLRDVFSQLGFKVETHSNQTAAQMSQLFNEYSKRPDLYTHDCFVAIVLTHGGFGGDLHGVQGHNVKVESLVRNFNNFNCPPLLGKPKLFFIQACRGTREDFGVADNRVHADGGGSMVALAQPGQRSLPTWSDLLICYSTNDGYFSVRNRNVGSWMGNALASTLVDHAFDLELQSLLMQVNRKIMEKVHDTRRYKQSLEIVTRGWDKQFYFNPGIFQ